MRSHSMLSSRLLSLLKKTLTKYSIVSLILTKLGFFNNKISKEHFPLKKVKFEYKNSSNTIELDTTEEIEKSDMKIVKRQIKKINDIPVESNLFINIIFI